ncbi:SUMF1/EgtB/PvdO family nonheme iron enzyme [Candidatus Poribacteria bacterium]|nr:SUMF1/EgtB/PvdO family nonheme iron enzyme [Candidatus Poribacteria bacterium]
MSKNTFVRYAGILTTLLLCVLAGVSDTPGQREVKTNKLDYGEAIYDQNRNAVVTIIALDSSGNPKGLGSGIITSAEGEVVTNYHVVKGAGSLLVKLLNGAMFPVEGLLASAPEQDFAVLKVNGKELPAVRLGSLKSVKVGQLVFALGSPLGMEQTFTNGMVSSIRDGSEVKMSALPKVIQHTAPISPGNSGGPLLNQLGDVIGINTLMIEGGQNLNFAVPIDYVKPQLGKKLTQPPPPPPPQKEPPPEKVTPPRKDPPPKEATPPQNEPPSEKVIPPERDSPPGRMVLIPAGEFQMGSNDGHDDEKPVHTVYGDAFYIDVYEVTNAQYKQFIDATDHPAPKYWNDSKYNASNQPVVAVTWYDAAAYCQWAGKRLPTEAEWEKAARGGLAGKKYPWGDSIDYSVANYDDKVGKTTPVGSYSPNGYGLYDMSGNVWEWCMDEWNPGFYAKSPRDNPVAGGIISFVNNNFTNIKTDRMVRGGSWDGTVYGVRVAGRLSLVPSTRGSNDGGFRCARAVSP